jgi:hypothetical protein
LIRRSPVFWPDGRPSSSTGSYRIRKPRTSWRWSTPPGSSRRT